jgi:hypothetical protein
MTPPSTTPMTLPSTTPMTLPSINYATRARLDVLVPSGNTIAEPELRAMHPPGVGLFVTRLPLTGSSETELRAMLDTLETGTALLADAQPDAITDAPPGFGRLFATHHDMKEAA